VSSRTRIGRSASSLGALIVAVALTGCGIVPSSFLAQVPQSGPIEQGAPLDLTPANQFIRVLARAPRPGMTPTQIVQGFLDASASFDADHAVAREYLTDRAKTTWDPGSGVQVYDQLPLLTEAGTSVRLNAPQAGRIAGDGTYSVANPGTVLDLNFTMELQGGQWRIARLPAGLVLSSSDVDRSFRALNVYFFNPEFSTLVPDGRLIPVVGTGQPTTLVRYLLGGPSTWLSPAVRTGFPSGVELNLESVPVEAGVARVDLSAGAALTDDDTRRAISQQLVWTLRQVPGVTAVAIAVNGQPLTVPGVANPQPRDAWPSVDPAAMPEPSFGYLTRNRAIVRLTEQGQRAIPGVAGSGESTLVELAVARNSRRVAGLDAQGTLWVGPLDSDLPVREVLTGRPLSSIAFGPQGTVWAMDARDGLIEVTDDGRLRSLSVEGLPRGALLRAAIPSRDGTRCALVIQEESGSSVLLARIVVSRSDGTPSITGPRRVEGVLTQVVDASWSGAGDLAVLGSQGVESISVWSVDLTRGTASDRGGPAAAVTVAAAPGHPILVGAGDGYVYGFRAAGWATVGNGTAPAYPG